MIGQSKYRLTKAFAVSAIVIIDILLFNIVNYCRNAQSINQRCRKIITCVVRILPLNEEYMTICGCKENDKLTFTQHI